MDNHNNNLAGEKLSDEGHKRVHSFFTKEKLDVIYNPLRIKICEAHNTMRTLLYSGNSIYPLTERKKHIMLASILKIRSGLYNAVTSNDYLELVQNTFIIEDILYFALTFADTFDTVESVDKKQVTIFRQEMDAFSDLFKLWVIDLKNIGDNDLESEWDFLNV